jgi:hypothetical protein
MDEDEHPRDEHGEVEIPVRKPTGREKFSVLLPALIALLGLLAMLIVFAVLVSMSRS